MKATLPGLNFAIKRPECRARIPMKGDVMEAKMPLSKVLVYQSVGFLVIMALTWLNELIALPSLIFGDHPLIMDYRESALKMLIIFAVWFLVYGSTQRLLARVRHLEKFIHLCAWCHHINFEGRWISMEEFMKRELDAPTTHGICPACLAKQKADLAARTHAAVSKPDKRRGDKSPRTA